MRVLGWGRRRVLDGLVFTEEAVEKGWILEHLTCLKIGDLLPLKVSAHFPDDVQHKRDERKISPSGPASRA